MLYFFARKLYLNCIDKVKNNTEIVISIKFRIKDLKKKKTGKNIIR